MAVVVDLRYVIPLMTNVLLVMLAVVQGKPWNQVESLLTKFDFHGNPPLLNLAFFFLLVFYLICFFVSLKLPVVITSLRPPLHAFSFTLIVEPIQIRVGDFSTSWTLAFVASILFPPFFFWVSVVFIAIGSCCNGFLWIRFKSFCYWIYRCLNKIPTILVTWWLRHEDRLPTTQPSSEIEMVEI